MMLFKQLIFCAAIAAASPTLSKRGENYPPDCNRFGGGGPLASRVREGINYLFERGDTTCDSMPDGSCRQVSCSYGAGIFVCSQGGYVTPTCNDAATYAQEILGVCGHRETVAGGLGPPTTIMVASGNVGRADPFPGYFIDVRGGDC